MNDSSMAELFVPASSPIDELIRRTLRVGDPSKVDEIASALIEAYENADEAYILLHYDLKKLYLKKILMSSSAPKIT